MIFTKYSNEYKPDVETLPDGSKKEIYVYAGPIYEYVRDNKLHKKKKRSHKAERLWFALWGIVFTALFFAGLIFDSIPTRTLYAILPYAIGALAIYSYIAAVFVFWPERETLKRRDKEKGIDRFKQSSLAGGILYFLSTIGTVIAITNNRQSVSYKDCLFLGCSTFMSIFFILVFVHTRRIVTKEIENPIEKNERMS